MPSLNDNHIAVLRYGPLFLLCLFIMALLVCPVQAEEKTALPLPHYNTPSTNLTGVLGVNTIPNARMDEKGTIRFGLSTSDPYLHGFIGFQLANSLYVNVRQTAEISGLNNAADALYPGIDFKLRLIKETATRPAMVLGFDSAVGHKKMGSEYFTLSKRFNNFDITGGVAWGRLGSAGHIKNPLRSLSSHFDKPRQYNSDQPQDASDWFTGEDIGFFGGIEYFTPIEGLSLKADYGANDYIGAQSINGFDPPSPWSLGFNYKPWEQIDFSAGIIGGEKVMARLSLQDQIFDWPGKPGSKRTPPDLISPRQNNQNKDNVSALSLIRHYSTGSQIGHATRIIANHASPDQETITLYLKHKGLKGPTVTLIRKDVEDAILHKKGNPEEIWQDATIETTLKNSTSFEELDQKDVKFYHAFRFILDNKLSLSEEDAGILYRSTALIEGEKTWPFGIVSGARARVNLADNLSRIAAYRMPTTGAIRNDELNFAAQRFSVDRLYGSWLKSLSGNTHIALTAGYLEEMFAGYGGEILYRPFGKTFAVGAEGWQVYKRDPFSTLNKELSEDGTTTGHLNLFYELPNKNTTLYAKLGRYIGTDTGGTIGMKTRFDNGTSLEGFVTASNRQDINIFGDPSHFYGGIKLNLPLGNIPFIPSGSEIRLTVAPFARDIGQTLDRPLKLYEVTEPISYRQLSRSWGDLLD